MSRPRERGSISEYQVLDVNWLNRREALPAPPADQTWVQLRVCDVNGNWDTRTQYIDIERIPCGAGMRPYFRCWCSARAVKLYRRNGFYRCRRCYNLAYECQREDARDRALRAAGKIKQRLGGDPDILADFPGKPRNMWWRTYDRAWYRLVEAEDRFDAAYERRVTAMMRTLVR